MTTPSPALLALLKRGVCAENIGNGRGVMYAADTWTTLKAAGFTHARLPSEMTHVVSGTLPQAVVDATFSRLDATVVALRDAGWAISLCPFGNGTLPNVDIIVETLTVLSARYAPMVGPDQLMFELRNEPHVFTSDQWNAAVPILIAAIRANAPLHTIVVPPVGFDMETHLSTLTIPDDKNVVFTVHFYEPAGLTQQGQNGSPIVPSYPFPAPVGTLGKTGLYTMEHLTRQVQIAADWARTHDVALMFGEIGCSSDAPAGPRAAWAAAMVHLIEGHDRHVVGWSWWGVDGKKFGLRPWKSAGAWDKPLLAALSGSMRSVPVA